MKKKILTCQEARQLCIVKTLERGGHNPKRRTETDAWYLSPLRIETKPSFHVSLPKNRWYDHGLGKGGNVIDLIMEMNQCSVKNALDFLSRQDISFSFQPQHSTDFARKQIRVVRIETISHPALIQYLNQRCIPLEIAREFCKEVWYTLNGKTLFAIGLKNHMGGWELRNKYYKNSTSPKSYTYFKKSSNRLVITEGMFDFLSLATLEKELIQDYDCLVLNSLSYLREVENLIPSYGSINLYLDNDKAGIEANRILKNKFVGAIFNNNFYSEHKDVNDFLQYKFSCGCSSI